MREAHYEVPVGLKPRNEIDLGITDNSFLENSIHNELLGDALATLNSPSLISSCFGTIDRILLTLDDNAFSPSFITAFQDLMSQLPASTQFVVLCYSNLRANLDQVLQAAGVSGRTEVVETSDAIGFSFWAEDAYVVVNEANSNKPILVEPANFTRYDDGFIADIVNAQTDIGLHSTPLYYQGGNVLIGDDFWMIGSDYPAKAIDIGLIQADPGESPKDAAIRRYSEELDHNRKMIIVGTRTPVPPIHRQNILIGNEVWEEILYYGTGNHQPLFHIDMFITLAGRDDAGKPIALVGDPQMAANLLNEQVNPSHLVGYYNQIADKLVAEGFNVIRNPLPLTYVDRPSEKRRYWYFATANNAIVQATDTSKDVWLPTYGHGSQSHLSVTDDANVKVWEDQLGFTVHILEDFNPFASNLGAVHCVSKYLQRG